MSSPPDLLSPKAWSDTGSPDHFERQVDDQVFDLLPSVVPDSQPANVSQAPNHAVTKAPTDSIEISESSLAEGFSWGTKPPPRPGQFSRRPHQEAGQSFDLLPNDTSTVRQPKKHSMSPPASRTVSQSVIKGQPFDLPELNLYATPSHTGPPPKRTKASASPPRGLVQSVESSSELQSGSANASVSTSQSPHANQPPPKSWHVEALPPNTLNLFPIGMQPSPPALAAVGSRDLDLVSQDTERSSPSARGNHDTATDPPAYVAKPHHTNHHGFSRPSASHLQQQNHVRRRQSPTSTCGDLERPKYQSPRHLRDLSREPPRTSINRPMAQTHAHERDDNLRHRSQSRVSNISRKRDRVRKSFSGLDRERQKTAMSGLARYWNECLQIAQEGESHAKDEIEVLRGEVRQRERKLEESRLKLEERATRILEVEDRYKELEERDARLQTDNEKLGDEAKALRDQLLESKQRSASLGEKYRGYRSKLNEAIAEQQQLYLKTQGYYETAKRELELERGRFATHSKSVDMAIEDSRKKREQMKKCVDELRVESEREHREKDQAIAQLKHEIADHEASLDRERHLAKQLRSQLEVQSTIAQSAQVTESKLDHLLELCTKKDEALQQQSAVTDHVNEKLEFILERITSSPQNIASRDDLQELLVGVQDNVVDKIMPIALSLLSRQAKTEGTLSNLARAFQHGAENLMGRIDAQSQKSARVQEEDDETIRHLFSVFKKFDENLQNTQETCHQMERRLDTWVQSDEQARQSCQVEFDRQLANRNDMIRELQQQIHVSKEDHASKIEKMTAAISKNDEATKKALDEVTAKLHNDLEAALCQEREKTERTLRDSETARNSLANQLTEAKERLTTANSASNPDVKNLQRSLKTKQDEIGKLSQRISLFEHEAKAIGKLREQWRRDIESFDKLRPQLDAIRASMPVVNTLEAKLDQVTQQNEVVQRTASYLTIESSWVHQQIQPRRPALQEAKHFSDDESEASTETIDMADELTTSAQKQVSSRRVIVNSPGLEARSPSPPMSVSQEQRQRRSAAQPHPILKIHEAQVSDMRERESQFFQQPVNHSQYNRPVKGEAPKPAIRNDMVQKIKDRLVQKDRSDSSWSFPTVADFERSSQEEAAQASRSHASSGSIESQAKRVKPENSVTISEESTTLAKRSDQRARAPVKKESTRIITKTYGRKLSHE